MMPRNSLEARKDFNDSGFREQFQFNSIDGEFNLLVEYRGFLSSVACRVVGPAFSVEELRKATSP